MGKTIQVVLGKPSKFYHRGKRVSVHNAYTYYTKGATFKFGTPSMSAAEVEHRQNQMDDLKKRYAHEDIQDRQAKKIQAALRGRMSRRSNPISPHPKRRVPKKPKPSGRKIVPLPPDMVGVISGFLGSKSMGSLAGTSKATATDTKEPMKRTKEVNAMLHKAIGMLREAPEEALEQVKTILKTGYKDTKPNLNAKVKPWHSTRGLQSVNLLTQVIADKFRGKFVYAYEPDDGDYSGVPFKEQYNGDDEEVGEPVEDRKLIDTSRFRIIKALLANGAKFNQQTVNVALSMKDAFTAVELFNQRPQRSQIKDFWTIKNKVEENSIDEPYVYQEIEDSVELKCVAADEVVGWGNDVFGADEVIEYAEDFIDNCENGSL